MMKTDIAIRGEPQANPELCRFIVDGHALYAGSHLCTDADAAQGSLLLEALFRISGITQVLVSGDSVTLQKFGQKSDTGASASSPSWPELGREVGAVLRAHVQSGKPFTPPVRSPGLRARDTALAQRVQALLDAQINPGVAGHGGKIELVEIQGTRAVLKMSGGCQGCGAAQMTLKQGVEKALRAQIPEITEVVDSTDHSAGRNPYYARG